MKQTNSNEPGVSRGGGALPDGEVLEPTFVWADIDDEFNKPRDAEGALADEDIFKLMVDRQLDEKGEDLSGPCAEAIELLDQWSLDVPAVDWTTMWREAADRRQAGETPRAGEDAPAKTPSADADEPDEPAGAPVPVNDALMIGTDCDEFEALMAREATFLTGKVLPDKPQKSTQAGGWKTITLPIAEHILGYAATARTPEYGLSRHPVGKSKDGVSFVFGSSIGGQRKAKAMDTMHAIGLDIDSGASLETVRDRILKMGVAAVIYTSWNHKKRGLTLKRDDVLKKLEIESDPTLEQVQEYLRNHGKNRFEEPFITAIEIAEQKVQEEDGVKIILDTPEIDKFRVVFFLADPVKIIDLAERHDDALAIWEDKITGLAQKHLGVHFDTSCTDPSRLFYTPRHAKGSKVWQSWIIKGKPLRFEDIQPMRKSLYTRNRDLNPFVEADDQHGEKVPQVILPSGGSLNDWHTKYGKERFLIADMLEAECPDKIRVSGGEKQGSVHTECPFEHLHSKEGGTATMATNCIDSPNGYWTWFCKHDACTDRHKLEFLGEAIREGWFPEDVLLNDDYLLPAEEEEVEDDPTEYTQPAPSSDGEALAAPEPKDALELVKKYDINSSEEDIRKFFKRLIKRGTDLAKQRAVIDALTKATALGKRDLNKMWAQVERDNQRVSEANEGGSLIPKVNETDFQDLVEYGAERIRRANKNEKRVFHYMENLCVVRDDAMGNARLKMLDERGFAHLLNSVATWEQSMGDNTYKGVSAPRDVVSHLFAEDYSTYPALRGVITSPSFSKSGQLIINPGYHDESSLYYRPKPGFHVDQVSKVPTDDEVREATRLLVEEVYADFPLEKKVRPEIVAAGLGEPQASADGVSVEPADIPTLANLMALTLLPFCREMVDGPTPGHIINKPAAGTGASLLTDVLSMIAGGCPTPAMAMPKSNEEMGKTLTSVLANGQNIVFFDNINHSVDTGELASAMTTPVYGARILGKSQTVQTEVRCVWILTGNNVTLSGELVRRLVMIDLNADVAHPERRSGWRHNDIRGWVQENRGRLVWACLTLIQNWIAQGKPKWEGEVLASFENWSRTMGGILDCAGIGGFMDNRNALRALGDDKADALDELRGALGEHPDGTEFVVGKAKGQRVSILDVLNSGGHDGEVILLPGWGYGDDKMYSNSRMVGKRFTEFAKSPHEVETEGKKFELRFTSYEDSKSKSKVYKMTKAEVA